jgi:uncharacterized protein (DUF1800 family)
MPYLDLYTQSLTAKTAAHLLRRATFGPTQAEISVFTGQTATAAVQKLISNANYSPPQPVDLDSTKTTAGQPYLRNASTPAGQYIAFNGDRNFDYGLYIKYWWLGLMTQQTATTTFANSTTTLLEKLTLFWQNHFVTTREVVDDYRFVWSYLQLLRNNALGNFRTLVTQISKEPAMLRYLNGDQNEVGAGKANENYARELQELFTVGAFDFAGNPNYTEDDVKNAARVLTGWKYTNYWTTGSTSFATTFTNNKHDSTNKVFSAKYGTNISISGRSDAMAGDLELTDLVTILLNHPQTSRFICRKLYRWYVNPNVTADIETNVIVPLAALFVSNNYNIQPVIEKLLTSQIFFDDTNIGAIVKSPAELLVGMTRFFNQPVPSLSPSVKPYRTLFDFINWRMVDLQLNLIDQPTVFGHEAYYQTGYSKLWINTTTMALRNDATDALIWRWLVVDSTTTPPYKYGIDLIAWVKPLQTNFGTFVSIPTSTNQSPAPVTASITCVQVLDAFLLNLFATDLAQSQKDFLIDKIMMMDQSPRTTWEFEWNRYRRTDSYPSAYMVPETAVADARNTINWRLSTLMRFMLRMAEFHLM